MDSSKDYYKIRNLCGLLGMALPFLALLSGVLIKVKPSAQWWWSISATYYLSPALTMVLSAASIVLITYDGYDWRDKLITDLSGVFGYGIITFPCKVNWISGDVGFFQLPIDISNIIHCVSAGAFFSLLAINSFFLFTLGESNTPEKAKRNIIYKTCGVGIFVTAILMVILQKFLGGWVTMIAETIMLQFFGISWCTKGGMWLRDKK